MMRRERCKREAEERKRKRRKEKEREKTEEQRSEAEEKRKERKEERRKDSSFITSFPIVDVIITHHRLTRRGPKWDKFQPIIKSYVANLTHLMTNVTGT